MKLKIILFIGLLLFSACSKPKKTSPSPPNPTDSTQFVIAVDISSFPEIEQNGVVFYNGDGQAEEMLQTLKNNGVNTIRLKLWHSPEDGVSGFQEVKSFSERIHQLEMNVWITVHYSDTWADPGTQATPIAWQGLDFPTLKDSMSAYTQQIMTQMQPEYVQIGNEINSGILFPYGQLSSNETQFVELIQTGLESARAISPNCKLILHYAGIEGADDFCQRLKHVDYDVIGISYYPLWHGKDIDNLLVRFDTLAAEYAKEILIAETAYPFTLEWADWTHNIVGLETQLILPDYPATEDGQRKFMAKISEIMRSAQRGLGFCYWGAERIAYKGAEATDGSAWENQAFYDFNHKALPVMEVFKTND